MLQSVIPLINMGRGGQGLNRVSSAIFLHGMQLEKIQINLEKNQKKS